MDMDEMYKGLCSLEEAINRFYQSGEEGLASQSIALMDNALDKYEREGGDRNMFDAALQ